MLLYRGGNSAQMILSLRFRRDPRDLQQRKRAFKSLIAPAAVFFSWHFLFDLMGEPIPPLHAVFETEIMNQVGEGEQQKNDAKQQRRP